MTKSVFSLLILWTIFNPLTAAAQLRCAGFLKPIESLNFTQSSETHLDADYRFYVARNSKIAAPISETPIEIKTSTTPTSARWNQGTDKSLDPIFKALNLEGVFYSLNSNSLFGYLKSLSLPSVRQSQTVQFVFWEGQGSHIKTSTVVQGTLLEVKVIPARTRNTQSERMENLDHISLIIQEKNALGELLNTEVKIPLALTGEKYRTVSPPTSSTSSTLSPYHWGLLVGVK